MEVTSLCSRGLRRNRREDFMQSRGRVEGKSEDVLLSRCRVGGKYVVYGARLDSTMKADLGRLIRSELLCSI